MKNVTKKLLSLILVMGFCILAIPGAILAESEKWDAECILGKQGTFKNVAVHSEVSG